MDKSQLDRIEAKVDRLDERLDKVDITLAAQHVVLKDHTRRSLAAEEANRIEKQAREDLDTDKVQPMQRKWAMVEGALKLIGLVGVLVAIVESIKHLIG